MTTVTPARSFLRISQAVHPHARVVRGGGVAPGDAPGDAATRRAAARPRRAARGHRARPLGLRRGAGGPHVRPGGSRRARNGGLRAGDQRADRRASSVPGARRPADSPGPLRRPRGPADRIPRRREQRRALIDRGREPRRNAHDGRNAARLRARSDRDGACDVRRPHPRRVRARHRQPGGRGARGPRGLHRRLGLHGAGRRARRATRGALAVPSRPHADGARRPRCRVPALPARPPRRGGRRRGHRRRGVRGLGPGGEPASDGAGGPARADHGALVLMRVVAALGGNALLRRGQPLDAATQRRNIGVAAAALAAVARAHELIVTHGNGPQVGLLALQAEAYQEGGAYPLDVLGAESEGMIGYLLQQGLRNALPSRDVATLLTQVVVDAREPAFASPTKPIGPVYEAAEAAAVAAARGWAVRPDGARWRRVVASPEPAAIVELETIRLLVDAGVLVICAGGGGVPVIAAGDGTLSGVEAVVDKDLAAALLAIELDADALLLLTDVPAV